MEGGVAVQVDTGYWRQVLSRDMRVPDDRPLADLTAELTTMLGSPDPEQRDGTAYPTLATWVERGVYDDLLSGLGHGMATGLRAGLGEDGSDSVFRRSFSVLVLAECIARDTEAHLLPDHVVMEWGDRIAAWFLRERDVRGWVTGKGWAHALAHGSDAIRALAGSHHLGAPELAVLLDVLADRLLDGGPPLLSGEPDRMAAATMDVLRRDLLPLGVLEPWVRRVASAAGSLGSMAGDPFAASANPQAFLRSLHLQLQLAPRPPAVRSDLLLVLVDALRGTNPHYLALPRRSSH